MVIRLGPLVTRAVEVEDKEGVGLPTCTEVLSLDLDSIPPGKSSTKEIVYKFLTCIGKVTNHQKLRIPTNDIKDKQDVYRN